MELQGGGGGGGKKVYLFNNSREHCPGWGRWRLGVAVLNGLLVGTEGEGNNEKGELFNLVRLHIS